MKNETTPAEDKDSAQLEAESALRGVACSASFESPQTMKYKYHSAKKSETAWIESPKGGAVGDMIDITCELNDLLHAWKEKCIEADALRQHLKIAQEVIDEKPACDHQWEWHATGAGMGNFCAKCGLFSPQNANMEAPNA